VTNTQLIKSLSLATLLVAARFAVAAGPEPIEDYTERPELWTCGAESCAELAFWHPIREEVAVGQHALALNYDFHCEHYLAFPKFRNAGWDLSSTECVEVRIKMQKGTSFWGPGPRLYLRDREGGMIRIQPKDRFSYLKDDNDGAYRTLQIPLRETEKWESFHWMDGSLKRVDWIEIAVTGSGVPPRAAHHVIMDGVRFVPEQLSYTPPNENAADLDVLMIERRPRYERYDVTRYDKSQINPNVTLGICQNVEKKHQPDPGETVTFTAHVQNKGRSPLGGTYVWTMDSVDVARGEVPTLQPREKTQFTWQWAWDPEDHDLTFRVTPGGEDYCDRNNALTIRTNALMLKHMIERGAITRIETKYNMMGSRSCEDYLQGQIWYMNQLFEKSTYPFAPNGITQRVMLGVIEYVDDGHCVSLGAGPYRVGELDFSADGGRGVTAYDDPWHSGSAMNEFLNYAGRPDGAWLHELGHQIGVIDDYQLITEPEDNHVNGVGFNYDYDYRGIMGGGNIRPHRNPGQLYSYYSPSDVMGLNVTKSKRRGYFGEYLYCIPKNNTLLIKDEEGQPVANAEIKLYQTERRVIDAIPEHEGRTDANGRFVLKNRKAEHHTTETGCTLRDNPFGPIDVVGRNAVFLIVVKQGDVEQYSFITVPDFNIACYTGHTERAELPVTVRAKGDERYYWAPPVAGVAP